MTLQIQNTRKLKRLVSPEFRKANPNPRKNDEENATMDPVKDIELIELENTTKSIM